MLTYNGKPSAVISLQDMLTLYQAGLEGAYLYIGSFGEWCRKYCVS